jgi:hypothetical protein
VTESGLTAKEELFVSHYLGDARGNATQAVRLAGYKGTDASLRTLGWKLLTKVDIRARIRGVLDQSEASAERTIRELSDVAFAEWRDFILIKTDPKTGEAVEVKMDLGSKVKSLELLAKYHKLLTDKQEVELRDLSAAESLDKKLLLDVAEGTPPDVAGEPDATGEG